MRSQIRLLALVTILGCVFQPEFFQFPTRFTAQAQTQRGRQAEADQLKQQGIALAQQGRIDAAFKSWQKALSIYREIKDRQGEGKVLGNIGTAYLSLGDYKTAIEYELQWLAIAREIKDRDSEGRALNNLGIAFIFLADYPKAIEYEQQALIVAREIKDREVEGKALGNLGVAYLMMGDYPQAIKYENQWLKSAREIGDRISVGNALGNLGLAYFYLGNYAVAIEYAQQWLAIARETRDPFSEGKALGNLGNAYVAIGEYVQGIQYQQQWLKIARSVGDRYSESAALGSLGLTFLLVGEYTKAIEYQQQSLAIARAISARNNEGIALGNLSLAYISLGDYASAINYLEQNLAIARSIKNRSNEGKVLGNLGIVYALQGDYSRGIDYAKQWLAIARATKDLASEGDALNNLGYAYYKQGNFQAAENPLMQAIEVKESLRAYLTNNNHQVSFFENQRNTYRTLQAVLIAQNKVNAALEIAERGRARAFVELLQARLSPEQTPVSRISPPTIGQIKQIAKSQNATLVEYSIIHDEFKIGNKIENKESSLYIWVIRPTGEVTFRSVDLKAKWQKEKTSLQDLVLASRKAIGVGERGVGTEYRRESKNNFKTLHEILIAPIVDLLPNQESDRVIFIPQRSLFLVPFAALQDEKSKYLIEKHTILTSPSIQVLSLTQEQRERVRKADLKDALVVGNPTMPKVSPVYGEPPQQLPPLPGAEKEATAIASLLKTQALTGNNATESAVLQRLPQARIVHLATHGILDNFQALNSAIALAPEPNSTKKEGNGLLSAEEILNLKLNASLVVLSACDTGRGRITGDGVIGLSRSLISAGATSVIVSLWSIPDAPTASLMTDFYSKLQENPDKAVALRQAMLATIKKHPDPRDWAAFTLIGEAE